MVMFYKLLFDKLLSKYQYLISLSATSRTERKHNKMSCAGDGHAIKGMRDHPLSFELSPTWISGKRHPKFQEQSPDSPSHKFHGTQKCAPWAAWRPLLWLGYFPRERSYSTCHFDFPACDVWSKLETDLITIHTWCHILIFCRRSVVMFVYRYVKSCCWTYVGTSETLFKIKVTRLVGVV